jgi:hypothetical protein
MLWLCGCSSDDNGTNGPENHPPVIQSLTADPDTFAEDSYTLITVIASDEDDDQLSYQWDIHGTGFTPQGGAGPVVQITNCCEVEDLMSAQIIAIVSDGISGETRDSVQVWVSPESGK